MNPKQNMPFLVALLIFLFVSSFDRNFILINARSILSQNKLQTRQLFIRPRILRNYSPSSSQFQDDYLTDFGIEHQIPDDITEIKMNQDLGV